MSYNGKSSNLKFMSSLVLFGSIPLLRRYIYANARQNREVYLRDGSGVLLMSHIISLVTLVV